MQISQNMVETWIRPQTYASLYVVAE